MVQTRRSLGSTSAQPKISPDLNQISRSFVSSVSHRKTDTENSKESEDGIEEEHETTFETHNTSTTSRKSENNEAFGERNFNFGLILICIVFAIFLFWLGSIPPQNLENEKYEHFKKLAISLRKKSYNHLNSETRLILGFIAKKALISTDKSPLVVVVGGAKSNNFVRDLEQILWKVQGNHKPHNPIVITDESSRAEMHITLKKNLESQIEKNHIVRSAIITNIDHLHWDAILVLHAFSDHENYPVEKTLLFMTVSEEFENNSESASDDSCDSKLTRYLQKKWITNGGSNDNVPPIISRIGKSRMPRHVVRDRAREDDDITQILSTMDTFEDKAADFNENFNWRRQWWHLLKPPKPAKINELSYIDDDEFTVKKSAFFRKTYKKIHEKEQRRESQTSLASSLNDSESEVEDEEKLKETKDEPWTMWNAYLFAQKTLFWSRIYILILQFIGANLFGDQFHTDAFRGADQSINVKESLVGEISVTKVFAGLRRWDAQQFLFIIDNDYIFETSLAFLPGYVGIVNFVKLIAASYSQWLLGFEVQGWVISSIVVVFLNLIFFHIAGMELFVITYQITRSIKIAMIAVSIFAYNPASIFFTAAYSESAYCLVTFTSIMMAIFAGRIDSLFTKSITTFLAAVFFAATVLLRSNGLLNIGFAMWYMLGAMLWESEDPIPDTKQFQDRMGSVRNRRAREELLKTYLEFEERRSVARKEFRFSNRGRLCIVSFSIVSTFTLLILVTTLPPFLFYGHTMTAEFCEKNSQQAMIARHWVKQHPKIAKNMIYAGQFEKLSFCRNPVMFDFWPTFYGAIQRKYWNVGLFGYWKLKKIPCFLMATPAFIITFLAIRFTFWDVFERRRWYNIWVLFGRPDHLLPFALHAAFLLFVGIFMINAEVFTRIIFSSTPFLYIYLAIWIDSLTQGNTFGNRMLDYANFQSFYPIFITKRVWNSSFIAKFFCVYLFVYFVFGTIAHSAWLPFT